MLFYINFLYSKINNWQITYKLSLLINVITPKLFLQKKNNWKKKSVVPSDFDEASMDSTSSIFNPLNSGEILNCPCDIDDKLFSGDLVIINFFILVELAPSS